MKNIPQMNFNKDAFKLAACGISLVSSLMGAIYFFTLGIPLLISALFGVSAVIVHAEFFFGKGKQ